MSTDVLLFHPQLGFFDIYTESRKMSCPPVGIGYLAAFLEKNDISVKAYDMTKKMMTYKDVEKIIENEDPIIVGVSTLTYNFSRSVKILDIAKQVNHNITTVLGGAHATFTSQCSLSNDSVDIVVIGEGEHTLLEIVRCIRSKNTLNKVRGIAFKKEKNTIVTPKRPLIKNLDKLPFPSIKHFEPLDSYHSYGIITGRGCPFKCIFCVGGRMMGEGYRVRSPNNVIEEIRHITNIYKIKHIMFLDDTFTVDISRVEEITKNLKEIIGDSIRWSCNGRVNIVTPRLLKLLADAGCEGILYGIESGNQSVLDSINKQITIEQAKRAIKWTVEAGIYRISCSFMIGHPLDNVNTVQETFDFIQELKKIAHDAAKEKGEKIYFSAPVGILVPLPGTFVTENAHELGVEILRSNDEYNHEKATIRTAYLTEKELQKFYWEKSFEVLKSKPYLGDSILYEDT